MYCFYNGLIQIILWNNLFLKKIAVNMAKELRNNVFLKRSRLGVGEITISKNANSI